MPILKREPDAFPASLFSMTQPWWVAHVRSRQEKLLARYLRDQGIAFYLPQTEKRRHRDRRTILSYLPLFPGYVFFRGQDGDTSRALRSHVIVNLLAPFDQRTFDGELYQLFDLQQSNGRLTPYPYLRSGDAVMITEGVFTGYRGVIVRERSSDRLVVSVSFIGQSVAVELDRDCVRPQHVRFADTRNA